jgi:MRG-binding protein
MIALHNFLVQEGYIHRKNEHTKPAGIWRKLETLYNLEALDEREDARQLEKIEVPRSEDASNATDEDADVYSEAANKIENEDFELPDAEFAQEKWERRLEVGEQSEGSSPPLMSELNLDKEPPIRFTPSFSIEPSEAATPVPRKGRPRGSTTGARGKANANTKASSTRRSTRQTETVADSGEDEEIGVASGQNSEDDGGEEESEEQEGSEQSTPAPRTTRSTKGRGRPARSQGRGRKR